MYNNGWDRLFGGLFVIGFVLGIVHLVNWLLAKGLIWVLFELFNVNWYGKFWVVYVALVIFQMLIKGVVKINNGRK